MPRTALYRNVIYISDNDSGQGWGASHGKPLAGSLARKATKAEQVSVEDPFLDLTGSSPVHRTPKRQRSWTSDEENSAPQPPQRRPRIEIISPIVIDDDPPLQDAKEDVIDLTSPPSCRPSNISSRHLGLPRRPHSALCTSILRPPPSQTRHNSDGAPIGPRLRDPLSTVDNLRVGAVFTSWEAAQAAVYAAEERLGHKWRIGQSKVTTNGMKKKITFRCNHYYHHTPTHSPNLDPSSYRDGQTVKTECSAHVNVNRVDSTNLWHITLAERQHNHEREIPEGGFAPRPPTQAQHHIVEDLAVNGKFSRDNIQMLIAKDHPNQPLELHQVSNMLNKARRAGRNEVAALGGDVSAILASLAAKNAEEGGWVFTLRLDETGTVIGLFWQSPRQVELLRRFSDIIINDNAYNRNYNQYPLNIGIIIDNHGHSRNCWYTLQEREDIASHSWIWRCHLDTALKSPEVVMSDRHPSVIAGIAQVAPLAVHIFCLYHLDGNVAQKLRPSLGAQWSAFSNSFWAAYHAVSPDEFDQHLQILTATYPAAAGYLNEELYPCRQKWAWAWISSMFTAGVRTNGRIESENCVNKALGGAKTTLLQLFNNLNDHTVGQTVKEMTSVCMVSISRVYARASRPSSPGSPSESTSDPESDSNSRTELPDSHARSGLGAGPATGAGLGSRRPTYAVLATRLSAILKGAASGDEPRTLCACSAHFGRAYVCEACTFCLALRDCLLRIFCILTACADRRFFFCGMFGVGPASSTVSGTALGTLGTVRGWAVYAGSCLLFVGAGVTPRAVAGTGARWRWGRGGIVMKSRGRGGSATGAAESLSLVRM